jgi:tripartite-type tricarboxylate transporter receptor subunit TctC
MFNMLSGSNVNHIPYKGAAPAVADVLGGHVAMTFVPIAAVVPAIRSGRLRALAVTAAHRSSIFPDLPTIAEAGVPGYDAAGWNAVLAPAHTPPEIVQRIHGAIVASLHTTKVRDILEKSGADAVGSTPAELGEFLRKEMAKWAKVVHAAGLKPQ